jgi:hypothetical protein
MSFRYGEDRKMFVIAMAYGGQPLKRIVTGKAHGLTYVANPSTDISKLPGAPGGVGFPDSAVFRFDSELMDALDSAWSSGDVAKLERLWREATPSAERDKLAA